MVRKLEPIVGEWYRDHGEQRLFEVVAMDDADGVIDIQYADGNVLALNRDSWRDLLLSMAPPPSARRGESEFAADADAGTSHLPDDDWHDSHDELPDEDY